MHIKILPATKILLKLYKNNYYLSVTTIYSNKEHNIVIVTLANHVFSLRSSELMTCYI